MTDEDAFNRGWDYPPKMGSIWAAWTSDMWELQNEGYFVLEDTDIWEASDSHRRRFERKRSYYLETYKRRTREPP